jgi:PTH1 family peptidyl-tRNA hydrolase
MVDAIAAQSGSMFRGESRFSGEVCRVSIDGQDVWLLKPMAYMNRSGQGVAALARYYKIGAGAILVAHDELDFPPGMVRLKQGGGHGGHNGLRDIIAHLGSREFSRLRIGIGHPGNSRDVSDYVLKRPPQQERIAIESAIDTVLGVLPDLVAGDREATMRVLHGR